MTTEPPGPRRPWPITILLLLTAISTIAIVAGVTLAVVLALNVRRVTVPSAISLTTLLSYVQLALTSMGGVMLFTLAYRGQLTRDAVATANQSSKSRDEHRASDKHVSDLLAKAQARLASDNEFLRCSGVRELGRLGQDYPQTRQRVVDAVCDYLRQAAPGVVGSQGASSSDSAAGEGDAMARRTATAVLSDHVLARGLRAPWPAFWDGVSADLTGVRLTDVNFSDCDVVAADFTGVTFEGEARFHRCVFGGPAVFDASVFRDAAHFADVRFAARASFVRTRFTGRVIFCGSEFDEPATFEDAWFATDTWFGGCQFTREAEFAAAGFGAAAIFSGARFSLRAQFRDARFLGPLILTGADFAAETILDRADFGACVLLHGCCFGSPPSMAGARFAAGPELTAPDG
jgi:uncharacterized protein YjbI with pentapeptide repeats